MKKVCSFLLCASILCSLFPGFPMTAYANDVPAEKVLIDYTCDSLKDGVLSVRGSKYPNYYIVDSETGKDENVAAGTILMGSSHEGGGDTSLVFNLPGMTQKTFSMKLSMKVEDLITPEHNALRRGFVIDFQVPGSRNIHIAVSSMTEPDNDGRNATVIVRHGWEDVLIHTETIAIPTDDAFHEWELLFNGEDELRLLIDGVLQAVFTEIKLNAVTETGFLRIGTSTQNVKSGTNRITLDHIKLTEGVPFSTMEIAGAHLARDSSQKSLTVKTVLNEQPDDDTVIRVKIVNEADRTQFVTEEYTPADKESDVTLTDLPFGGVCEVIVSATGARDYSFYQYLRADYETITAGTSIEADTPGKAYYFGGMHRVDLPAGSKWSVKYIQHADGGYGSVLTCQNISSVHELTVPVTLNGKFAVYVGYVVGTQKFAANGTEVFVSASKEPADMLSEVFAVAGDFNGETVTISNVTGETARLAYVKFVALSEEDYALYCKEDDAQNFIWDDDGYSCFCYNYNSTPEALCNHFITRYAEKLNVGQFIWTTYYTSILNYDSPVWWKYVTERLKELNIPEEKWPEHFLDHVDKEGNHLEFAHLMRDIDKTAYKNMLKISESGIPHEFLSDFAKENGYGDVYVSLKMSSFADANGPWAFMNSTLYYLYPEFIRGSSYQFSFMHETYRNYMHDLLIEMASAENVSGVMMSFTNYPYIFGSELLDIEERTRIMNEFVESVRKDMPKGKKLIASISIPAEEHALSWGLDYITWVKEGWIDRLITRSSGKEKFLPFQEFIDLCDQYDCEYYLGMSGVISGHDMTKAEEDLKKQGVEVDNGGERVSKLQYLLRAYDAYTAGADGLYVVDALEINGTFDPAYKALNNKTLITQWYTFSYPAILQNSPVTFVGALSVPDAFISGGTAETSAPEETAAVPESSDTIAEASDTAALEETTADDAVTESAGTDTARIVLMIAAVVVIGGIGIRLAKKEKA